MIRILLSLIIALSLTSCAVAPPAVNKAVFNVKSLEKTKLDMVESGQLSMIMYEFSGEILSNNVSQYVNTSFKNIQTGQIYEKNHPTTHLPIIFVPPGDYQFQSWANSGSGVNIDSGSASRHFEPFTVKAGEYVYLGSIRSSRRKVKYTKGRKQSLVWTILTPTYDPNSTYENVYEIKDKTKLINNRWVPWYYPELKGKVVTRLMQVKQNVTSFEVIRARELDRLSDLSGELKESTANLSAAKRKREAFDGASDEDFKQIHQAYRDAQLDYYIKGRDFIEAYITYYDIKDTDHELIRQKKELDLLITLQEARGKTK